MKKIYITYFPSLNKTVSLSFASPIVEETFRDRRKEFPIVSMSDMMVPNTGHEED